VEILAAVERITTVGQIVFLAVAALMWALRRLVKSPLWFLAPLIGAIAIDLLAAQFPMSVFLVRQPYGTLGECLMHEICKDNVTWATERLAATLVLLTLQVFVYYVSRRERQ
jgi:hypothetical protein